MQLYFVGLVVVCVLAAAAAAIFVRARSNANARDRARSDAQFAATQAAGATTQDVLAIRAAVSQLAASPGAITVLSHPQDCSLSFSTGSGSGHIAVLRPDGQVACSSATGAPPGAPSTYAGASWLAQARRAPVFLAPVTDSITGQPSVLFAQPLPGHGIVAAFVNLVPVAEGLAATYSGGNPIEILVTSGRRTVLSRSIEPSQWAGASLTGTPFAGMSGGRVSRDVQGTSRLYEAAAVPGLPWTVYAGYDQRAALARATGLQRDQLRIIAVGLLVILLAAALIYRGVARPIERLARSVRAAGGQTPRVEVATSGPAQVQRVGEDVNALIHSVNRELLERERAERHAAASEHNYRALFDESPTAVLVYDAASGRILEVNRAAQALYGHGHDAFLALGVTDIDPDHTTLGGPIAPAEPGGGTPATAHHTQRNGAQIEVQVTSYLTSFGERDVRVALVEDVGERERLQRQLRQSQRLESLGQLAGGVAHDFNNLLGVVIGYASLLRGRLETTADRNDEALADVEQIELAGRRGAELTRQLLLFARREVTHSSVIDAGGVFDRLAPLLRQTLGDHVVLRTSTGANLWPVAIDPGQLEQILVNLAINARDAMPDGGDLTIDATNVSVDELYALTRPGLPTGDYTVIRVSDTGCGMDDETAQRVFEPFFTTKAPGAGTGLGLATVYGIVSQAGGRIQVYSEPGHGTTFSIMLPAVKATQPTTERDRATLEVQGGDETVLVVEDEDALRDVTARMLRSHGYRVLTAADGSEAIALAGGERIDLLLTDVVMPGLLGREVAERVGALQPGVRVLYVSGYAEPVLGSQGTLDAGAPLLEKPFSEPALLGKVREALAEPEPPAGADSESIRSLSSNDDADHRER